MSLFYQFNLLLTSQKNAAGTEEKKTTHNPLGIRDESAWRSKDVILRQRIQVCATTYFVTAHGDCQKWAIKQATFNF